MNSISTFKFQTLSNYKRIHPNTSNSTFIGSKQSLYSSFIFCCRVSVSGNMLAVPMDNRHIRIYSLQGNRLAQLPRRNNQVCCEMCAYTMYLVYVTLLSRVMIEWCAVQHGWSRVHNNKPYQTFSHLGLTTKLSAGRLRQWNSKPYHLTVYTNMHIFFNH